VGFDSWGCFDTMLRITQQALILALNGELVISKE